MPVIGDRTVWDQVPDECTDSPCSTCNVGPGPVCDDCGGFDWQPETEFDEVYLDELEYQEERLDKKERERKRSFSAFTIGNGPDV